MKNYNLTKSFNTHNVNKFKNFIIYNIMNYFNNSLKIWKITI